MGAGVAVVIPAWGAARFLAEAVSSVLAQTRPPDEVVVVVDGATDGTEEVARELAEVHPVVRTVVQPNAGPGAARDRGIAESTAELIALLDADDRWAPTKLEQQVSVLDARPEVDAVFCEARNFFDGVAPQGTVAARVGHLPSAVVFRRAVLARVGGFDDIAGPLQDWVPWFLRLRDGGVLAVVPEVLVERRIHDANRGRQRTADGSEYAQLLAARIRERRSRRGSVDGVPQDQRPER